MTTDATRQVEYTPAGATPVAPKPRNRFLAWLLPLPQPEALSPLLRALGHTDREAYVDACAQLAQLGMSAEDVEQVVHAVAHRRILAFSPGRITDLGEYGNHLDGSTRGSAPYGVQL